MGYVVTPDTLASIFGALDRRLSHLENANPYQFASITDGSGTLRAEFGALLAAGTSPAQFGERVWDPSARLLFDTNTLAMSGSTLGIGQANPGQTITSTTFVGTAPAITCSFTVSYPTRIRAAAFATLHQNAAGKNAYMRLNLVGVGTSEVCKFGGGATANSMDLTNAYTDFTCAPGGTFATLAPGAYTATLEVATDAGGSLYFDQGYCYVSILSPAAY